MFRHGGRIGLRSTLGVGTTFFADIPFALPRIKIPATSSLLSGFSTPELPASASSTTTSSSRTDTRSSGTRSSSDSTVSTRTTTPSEQAEALLTEDPNVGATTAGTAAATVTTTKAARNRSASQVVEMMQTSKHPKAHAGVHQARGREEPALHRHAREKDEEGSITKTTTTPASTLASVASPPYMSPLPAISTPSTVSTSAADTEGPHANSNLRGILGRESAHSGLPDHRVTFSDLTKHKSAEADLAAASRSPSAPILGGIESGVSHVASGTGEEALSPPPPSPGVMPVPEAFRAAEASSSVEEEAPAPTVVIAALVEVPASPSVSSATVAARSQAEQRSGEHQEAPAAKAPYEHMRLLIVDDGEYECRHMRELLRVC